MADQIVDSITSSGSSPTSILNRLPTKRINAAITAAGESGKPEQGEQTDHMNANDPDKTLTGSQKATLTIMGHISGGANIVSLKRWVRRLMGASVVTAKKFMAQDKFVGFIKWIVSQ